MIYLIGGPPKCGKTTLSKKIVKDYQIPWISADTLQNIVSAYMAKGDHEKYFPHSYLKGEDNDETYSQNTTDSIINEYINQGKTSYKAISMMAETQLIDEDDYVVEGYQVTPEVVDEVRRKFGDENVRAVFLVKHDQEKIVQNIHKSSTPNDWIIRRTKEEATFSKIAKMISDYSKYFEEEARKYGFPVLNMDQSFENKLEEAIKHLQIS